ncbi:IS66 family insertion sequence element accessory protein TnpA [Filimonas effusa]|uniref:IS66 family insertion sequence element accessory protein TnpA n=1 Tax=Filimonas effusa TaxID=2508721 RepID=UPI0013E93EFA|nr:IS66 family insertion sequence element accessory protein TnpB [Filimonas effusa]
MERKSSMQSSMYAMVREWQQSGLNQKAYCEQKAIKYFIFHYWYRKFRDEHSGSNSFVQIPSPSWQGQPFAECHFTNGTRLILHQPVSIEYLKSLMG